MFSTYRPDLWLQNAASLAISALLARLDLEQGGRPLFWVDFREKPPAASHSYWDYCDIAGRFVDGLVLGRVLTGDTRGAEAEAMLREFLWDQQDPDDGLFYNPEGHDVSSSETSKYLDDTSKRQRPRHVDLFCQKAPMLALTTLMMTGNQSAHSRLRRMVSGLSQIAEWNGDEARFASYRWAPIVRPEWVEGISVPERWIGYRYALLAGLARYVELSADPEATRLALGLAILGEVEPLLRRGLGRRLRLSLGRRS